MIVPMQRRTDSHKGENGKVAVIGGSRHQHGAPIFSALAAEATGVDLLYIALPACHEEVAKAASLNFQVHPFAADDLTKKDREPILELLATIDCAVIGPGIARTTESIAATLDILAEASCPLVVDATALQPDTLQRLKGKTAVLTPHLGELERMKIAVSKIGELIERTDITVLLKGEIDVIFHKKNKEDVAGGNAGLTVGGTGDALAGCVAGLIAQGIAPSDAAMIASIVIKRAGAMLMNEYGYAYGTRRVIDAIPLVLRETV